MMALRTDSRPVAIVTGASRGIGKAVAEALAHDGYRLALASRSTAAAPGPDVLTFAFDISDEAGIRQMTGEVMKRFGRVDVLFNNAGIFAAGTSDMPIGEFDRVIDTNVRGAFLAAQAVAPIMMEQKSGYIINLSSRAGKIGFAANGVYCASKFAVGGFSESLFRKLAPYGVRVTALCPSYVNTDLARFATHLADEEKLSTDDIVQTVRYLLSLRGAVSVREIMLECRKLVK